MVHPKKLHKIKLEDVVAIYTNLMSFLAAVIIAWDLKYKFSKISRLCLTIHLFEGFKQNNSLPL